MKFIGTKEVEATPMTAEEAIEKGYKVGNHKGNGYEVTYKDGYKSWSPKDVFDEAYKRSETYTDRLNIEYCELEDKLEKLKAFINSDRFEDLGLKDKSLLKNQCATMEQYRNILEQRIFPTPQAG